jgi:hypothetical protein
VVQLITPDALEIVITQIEPEIAAMGCDSARRAA